MATGAPPSPPLSVPLSQALVAFTIEVDNEFEHRTDHRTASRRPTGPGAPWLTSQVMWANVLQYVDDDGLTVDELHARSRTTRDSLAGLQRWGYVTVRDGRVRPTAAGRRAQTVWRPLAPLIEARWSERFGPGAVAGLRDRLTALLDQLDLALPAYLPIVHPTQSGKAETPPPRASASNAAGSADLSVLLAQVLLAFTLDFEQESALSLPISANPLRVVGPDGTPVRDLPRLTGVSKEANAMASGFLARRECVTLEPARSGRGQVLHLTDKGRRAQAKYHRVTAATEGRWRKRYGGAAIDDLRTALLVLTGDGTAGTPLFAGLEPYPDGWRAAVRRPATLRHYPMVLHRGGYPDGG